MIISGKIKKISNKIKQNKVQYDIDRKTANNSAVSSRHVGKYEFVTFYQKNDC